MINVLLAALAGVLFAWAFPDVAQGWLAFIAFAPLLIAIVRAKSTRQAVLLGWLSQTIAWLIMVPWVVRVMSHYGGVSVPVGIALLIAMALILGAYGALFAWAVYRFRLDVAFGRWLLVPLAWAAAEYARTYLLTGFPWNLIATAIVDYPTLIQIDRAAGPYFTGALILFPSTVIAWWVTQKPTAPQRVVIGGMLGILALVWWGTGLVASKLLVRPTGTPPVKAAMLQPNIAQEMRWDAANTVAIYQKMIAMTMTAADNGAQIIIWPESTVPLSYSSTAFYRDSIEQISRDRNVDIILGSVAEDPEVRTRIWNSAFLTSGGRTVGHYDKIRLVPFGEYVPLRKLLFFAEKLVRAVGEFSVGTNDQPLTGKLKYGPAICYEVVYPQISRTQINNGAEVIVTITNDAWFDGSSAPRQHLNQARLRAVEGDRYMLRAGTTGISAFIDPTGQIRAELPMGREGIVYAEFQPRRTETLYVKFGDWFAWLAATMVLVGMVMKKRKERRTQNAE
ncbi:MAG TPA: apolipoprotein N-acyltransferase [Thermoanaerobaculia bacterium]